MDDRLWLRLCGKQLNDLDGDRAPLFIQAHQQSLKDRAVMPIVLLTNLGTKPRYSSPQKFLHYILCSFL